MSRYRITLAQDARVYTSTVIEADDDTAAVAQGAAAVRSGVLDPDWDDTYQGRGPGLLLGYGDRNSLALIVDRLGNAPEEITEIYEGDPPLETVGRQDDGPSCAGVKRKRR